MKHGANVNARGDEKGMTHLHFAALGGYADVVELLLYYDAYENAEDDYGFTACIWQQKKEIQIL